MTTNELDRLGLAGRTVHGLAVNHGDDLLVFRTDVEDVLWGTDADCCSETWFSDVVGLRNLLGQPVLAITEFDPPGVDDGRCRQEVDSFYGVRLTTPLGACEITYRNSSNGYYGGSIFLVGSEPAYLYYRIALPQSDVLITLLEDWHATITAD